MKLICTDSAAVSRLDLALSLTTRGLKLAALLLLPVAAAMTQAPPLGTAGSFAVLGGSAVTNTGSSVITGDLGVSPGTSVTGFPPGIVTGTIHIADAGAAEAQSASNAHYNALASAACTTDLTGQDLGGLTLTPGVYCYSTSAQLTGTLTLDGLGNPNSHFIFQIGSTLTTASASSVNLINGAGGCSVFWQIGSSATFGAGTSFVGDVLAQASITMVTGSSLSGRAVALTGAVTLDNSTVAVPPNTSADWNNYGVGWPGTLGVPSLQLDGAPVLGSVRQLIVGNSRGSMTFSCLLWGADAAVIPTIYGGSYLVVEFFHMSIVLQAGNHSMTMAIPADPSLCGVELRIQVVLYDEGASHVVAFTPGLWMRLGL